MFIVRGKLLVCQQDTAPMGALCSVTRFHEFFLFIPAISHVVHAIFIRLINGFSFHICVIAGFAVPCYIFHVYFVVGVAEVKAILLFKATVVLVPFQNFLGGYTSFFIMCVVVLQVAFQILAFFYFIDCLGFYTAFLFLTVVSEVFLRCYPLTAFTTDVNANTTDNTRAFIMILIF